MGKYTIIIRAAEQLKKKHGSSYGALVLHTYGCGAALAKVWLQLRIIVTWESQQSQKVLFCNLKPTADRRETRILLRGSLNPNLKFVCVSYEGLKVEPPAAVRFLWSFGPEKIAILTLLMVFCTFVKPFKKKINAAIWKHFDCTNFLSLISSTPLTYWSCPKLV